MKPSSVQEFLDALIQVRDVVEQRAFVADSGFPACQELIEDLSSLIREWLPKDHQLAEVLAQTNLFLASELGTPLAAGFAHQCQAYVFMNMRQGVEAQPFFEKASDLFAEAGAHREFGRSLVAQSENLMSLGEFDRAHNLAKTAERLLEAAEDTEYLPRVHVTLGNLFYRRNQFRDSLREYDRAFEVAEGSDQFIVVVAVEMNRAEALTQLNRFDEAIRSYEKAREYCVRHEIGLWFDILDKNIADLYFKRGSYSEALRSLEKVRPRYREQGDDRRLALCDLERAEIYLQLNLPQDAADLAESALTFFEGNSSPAETAQCLALVGIARSDRGETATAQQTFRRAGDMFRGLGRAVDAAAVDLQLAKIQLQREDFPAAENLASAAAAAFEAEDLAVRGAYARVTLALSLRGQGRDNDAIDEVKRALASLSGYHAKWVSYQCYDLMGTLQASKGGFLEAERLYRKAIEEMESLRGNIQLDEFRMSFGKDKYQVYENLVGLKIKTDLPTEAFEFVERSKSRTLIDLLERNTDTLWQSDGSNPKQRAIHRVRQDLNGLYSRLSQVGTTVSARATDKVVQEEISRREQEMISLLREAGSEREGWATLESMPMPSVEDVGRMLSENEILIEYYTVQNQFCAFVIRPDGFHFVKDLAETDSVRSCLKGLNFQLSKFHLSEAYLKNLGPLLLRGVRHHLQDLYRMLIAPLDEWIEGRSLVIIPHHVLHYVPFQALYDGSEYVLDKHDVVYSPSAAVLKICRARTPAPAAMDLVLAVPDPSSPAIADEADMLRELLPNARVFVGEEAGVDRLKEHGASAGKLHIAAHGVFRADNPMFSALKLGDSWLNLVDIFNLKLGGELTTLSACETGMSAVYEGDELLGLTRGFLYAGTPSLVVSLWRVNDRSTTLLMKRFYEGLLEGLSKPAALRQAGIDIKARFPHPYYWAPFILMGKS